MVKRYEPSETHTETHGLGPARQLARAPGGALIVSLFGMRESSQYSPIRSQMLDIVEISWMVERAQLNLGLTKVGTHCASRCAYLLYLTAVSACVASRVSYLIV